MSTDSSYSFDKFVTPFSYGSYVIWSWLSPQQMGTSAACGGLQKEKGPRIALAPPFWEYHIYFFLPALALANAF
jgi:hypothetical protein